VNISRPLTLLEIHEINSELAREDISDLDVVASSNIGMELEFYNRHFLKAHLLLLDDFLLVYKYLLSDL